MARIERDDLAEDRRSNEDAGRARQARGKFRYYNRRLDLDDRPVRIHFDRPDKLYKAADNNHEYPWKRHYTHFIPGAGKRGNGAVVECADDQCLTCAYGNPKAFGFKNVEPDSLLRKCDKNIGIGISGWVEEMLHLVTQKNRESGKEFKNREFCTGRNCEYCKKKMPMVFGKPFHISFSVPQWDTLRSQVFDKAKRTCRCGGYLYPESYVCRKCETDLVSDITGRCPRCGKTDVGVDPEHHVAECNNCEQKWALLESDDIELKKIADTQAECPKCGYQGYPAAKLVCTGTEKNGGECEGDPHDLYDVSIVLKKEEIGKKKQLVVVSWEITEPDERLFLAKHQGKGEGAEFAAKGNKSHIDLDAVFAPDPPSRQAEVLERDNLFRFKGGETHYRNFKGNEEPETEEAVEEESDS